MVSPSPQKQGIYSHVEVSNIIMAMKWMEKMRMIEYLSKSTTNAKEIQQNEYK
jgi:hypothetical protein